MRKFTRELVPGDIVRTGAGLVRITEMPHAWTSDDGRQAEVTYGVVIEGYPGGVAVGREWTVQGSPVVAWLLVDEGVTLAETEA